MQLVVVLKSSPGSAQALVDAFRFLTGGTRLDLGCVGCMASIEPDFNVHYVEQWVSEADMRRRVQSESFTSVLALLESAEEPPQVQFDFITRTRGLDYVEEVRRQSGRDDANGETRRVPPEETNR